MRQVRTSRFLRVAVVSLVLATTSAANGQPSRLSGIFSNVEENPNSGDLHGTELEIHADVRGPFALVTLCQSWCNQSHRVPIRIDGNRFKLSFTEHYIDASGAPVDTTTYRITGRLLGRTLRIKNSGYYPQGEVLRRKTRRFGLAVAHPAPAEL